MIINIFDLKIEINFILNYLKKIIVYYKCLLKKNILV